MYYNADANDHGLPHDPFKALIAPRPIGWISTRSRAGQSNLAPYSYFNALCDSPKLLYFASSGSAKDSATFAEESGEFVANFVSAHVAEAMNHTSINAPRGHSEFGIAGLREAPCQQVAAPRVAEAYAAIECKVTQVLTPHTLDGSAANAVVVIGQVVGVYIDDAILTEGKVDIVKALPVSRLGYLDFAQTTETFSLSRPRWKPQE